MKTVRYSKEKDLWLQKNRGIGFEQAKEIIFKQGFLEVIQHPNTAKYPKQRIFIIVIDNYAYAIPFVETEKEIFLKTIYPSRKHTKKYLIKVRKLYEK